MLGDAFKNRRRQMSEAEDEVASTDIIKTITRYQYTLGTRWSTIDESQKPTYLAKMNTLTQALILAYQGNRTDALKLYTLAKTIIK